MKKLVPIPPDSFERLKKEPASFTEVLQKVCEVTPKHLCFKRDSGKTDETGFRYVFHQPTDKNREVILSVLVFDMPRPEKTPKESSA
jgi:hypothetical protein